MKHPDLQVTTVRHLAVAACSESTTTLGESLCVPFPSLRDYQSQLFRLPFSQGSVTNRDDVFAAIPDDCVGVVVALGGRPPDVGDTMLRDGTALIVEVRACIEIRPTEA